MKRRAVIVIPAFYSVHTPNLGASIVKSIFEAAGYSARILYANIDLWDKAPDAYEALIGLPHELLLGEWLFGLAAATHNTPQTQECANAGTYLSIGTTNLEYSAVLTDDRVEQLLMLRQLVPGFLIGVVAEILSTSPDVVAFSSSFHQTACAVAIASRLKRTSPQTITVLGGANTEGPMGEAMLGFAVFDVVYSGQAESGLLELLSRIDETPRGTVIHADEALTLKFLKDAPDFSDYFARIRSIPFLRHVKHRFPLQLPVETSRGCWWGQVHHCTFCGLNGASMHYRKKDAPQVVDEISLLALQWQQEDFCALDNIMPTDAVVGYLERLGRLQPGIQVFFEVKANLTGRRLDELVAAGVSAIQPGIESLSSPILAKIDKGLTSFEAVRLLRDCEARRIRAFWNSFTEIPNDEDSDYSGIADLVECIVHLQPPATWGPIRVDRFSPYFTNPERYGIAKLDPFPAYSEIFDKSVVNITQLAYHFKFERMIPLCGDQVARKAFIRALEAWTSAWKAGYKLRPRLRPLIQSSTGKTIIIEDTRPCAAQRFFVAESEHITVLAAALNGATEEECGNSKVLGEFLDRKFIIPLDGKYLTLLTDYPKNLIHALQ